MTMNFAHANRLTPDGAMNFSPPAGTDFGSEITRLLDEAMVAASRAEYEAGRGSGTGDVAQKRIGAGYIGTECDRELAYRYHRAEKEERESTVSPGELQRHAESGHWTEDKTAEWLRLAGFDLCTFKTNEDGSPKINSFGKPEQIGFKAAWNKETGQARLAGEVDGVIHGSPLPLKVPMIWESKKATAKKWKKFSTSGVAVADPPYYGQLQTNMAYMQIDSTLFSMLNLDNMKYYWEIVPFDQEVAQALTDRAARIFASETPAEFARITSDPSNFKCRFCDYAEQCWTDHGSQTSIATPGWLAGDQA